MFYLLALLLPLFLISKEVNVFITGTGVVGGALLEQIKQNRERIAALYDVDIRVVGIANSRQTIVNPNGIDLNDWQNSPNSTFLWQSLPNPVFVDCTSNQEIADSYAQMLESGISIVTPNKKANSSSYGYYKTLRQAMGPAKFYYDANVGAGLPILSTIEDLLQSGDEIVKVEAILSGTLSYIFNSFGPDVLFSDIVRDAQKKGYTEPDPRDDLNGMDMARKLLIIARETGLNLEMKDIEIESLLPQECFEAQSIDDFYTKLKSCNDLFSQPEGKRLLYIAKLEDGKASMKLQSVGPEHPFFHLSGCDNIAAITTKYYSKNPLVIQGPGAGADVTAAKVLQGIVQVGLERK